MATVQGNCYGTYGSHYDLYLDYSVTSQEIGNNRSYVKLRQWAQADSTSYTAWSGVAANNYAQISIDGALGYNSNMTMDFRNRAVVELGTWEGWVGHNADGTKTVALYGKFDINGPSSLDWGDVSYNFVLTTIPRATQVNVSASTATMGTSITVNTPRPAGTSFTHTLTYVFGNASGTIASGVETSQAWTLPLDLASQIPSSTSGSGTITCRTYNGGTHIGTTTCGFTALVTGAMYPWVDNSVTGNALLGGNYVQNKSTLNVSVSEGGSYSSWITYRNTTITGASSNGAQSFLSSTLTAAGSIAITTTVTDSRGRSDSHTSYVTVVAYSIPTVTSLTAFRSNADGTANPSGAYIKMTASGVISSVNTANGRTATLRHRVAGTSTWTNDVNVTNTYSPSMSFVASASTASSFEVGVYIADTYSSATAETSVSSGFVLMDFHSSGNSMAIGKAAEGNGVLELGGDLYVNSKKTITKEGALYIEDCRTMVGSNGATTYYPTPNNIPENSLSGIFGYFDDGLGWRSSLFVKGWGSGYSAWRISGPAATGNDNNYFLQSGVGSSWSPKVKIWHDGNDGMNSGLDADLVRGVLLSNTNDVNVGISITNNTIGYVNGVNILGATDGALYNQAYSTAWVHQIFGDYRTGQIALRGKNNGTYQSWRTVWDSGNATVVSSAGANGNGSYIKFTNGTMICWGEIPTTAITNLSEPVITFPATFYSTATTSFVATGRPSASWTSFGIVGQNVAATTGGRITVATSVAQNLIEGKWSAIGRWY